MNSGGKGWREAVDPFRLLTTTLLNLLLPLSFLLLSRVSSASFFLSLTPPSPPSPPQSQTALSFFLHTNPTFVCFVVSSICLYTLLHGVATKIAARVRNPSNAFSLHINVSRFILFLLEISVGLGFERMAAEGVKRRIIMSERNFLIRLMFFFGLYEVMIMWCRVIVKPVVDRTLFGEDYRQMREDTVAEKVAFAMSCGTLWWWKLRDEVEALACVAEAKRAFFLLLPIDGNVNVSLDVSMVDFVNWWLYHMVVTIGIVRIGKGSLWFGMILLSELSRIRNPHGISGASIDSTIHFDDQCDNKV